MSRTDAQSVAAILPGSPDIDALEVHVQDAHNEVNEDLPVKDIPDKKLELIERYLAAHAYKYLTSRQLMQFTQGSSTGMFTGRYRDGLEGTSYGQMAIEADPTGILANRTLPRASIDILDSRGID